MTWYYWDPETDVTSPAKYQFMRDPEELFLEEMVEINRCRMENLRVGEATVRGYWISTVFLSLDHGWGRGAPVLFETMILGPDGEWLNYQARYETGREARRAHERLTDMSRWLLLRAPQVSNKNYKDILHEL